LVFGRRARFCVWFKFNVASLLIEEEDWGYYLVPPAPATLDDTKYSFGHQP